MGEGRDGGVWLLPPTLVLPRKGGGKWKCTVSILTALVFFLTYSLAFAAEPVISRVALSEKVMDLSRREKSVIQFQLSEKAPVDLKIYNETNTLIREVKSKKTFPKGNRTITWDGRNQTGDLVTSGVYYYVLEAKLGITPDFVHDLRGQTGGQEIFVEKLNWDVP